MSIDYGIEWAYGEFRISKLRGNEVVESWKSPEPVTDLMSLNAAMYEACHHVDISKGGSVAIAYEDDLHTHEFLEVPPMGRRDMEKYLTRHVTENKPFTTDAAWRFHPVSREGRVDGVLLHLMPKYIVDAVMRICEEFYLKPKLLVPLTEIMSEYVPGLHCDENEALLLIALFDERTQMLISSDKGEILFVRELSYAWNKDNQERFSADINRTAGYAKQRIGGSVKNAWLIGERAGEVQETLSGAVDIALQVNDNASEPEFWMKQVAVLPQRLASNFIPLLARSSITGKTMMRAGVLITAAVSVAALVFCSLVEYTLRTSSADSLEIQALITEKEQELDRLNAEVELMELEKTKLDILNVDAFNLPAIFLSHLGDLVPEGLVLTNAEVKRGDNQWAIVLAGKSTVSLGEVAPLLSQLQGALEADPWNTQFTVSWEVAWMQQLTQGRAAQSGDVGFEMQGILQ